MKKIFDRIRDLRIKKCEVEDEESEIIDEITYILTKETGLRFECIDTDGDCVYFEPESLSVPWVIKVELFPFLRLIYVNDCEDEEVKDKIEALFKNGF